MRKERREEIKLEIEKNERQKKMKMNRRTGKRIGVVAESGMEEIMVQREYRYTK